MRQKISILPKSNPERKRIIDMLRKRSQFYFNSNGSLNDGELIVCRRPQDTLKKNPSDFQACPNCKGFFSKNNIRHHAKQSFQYNGSNNRTLMTIEGWYGVILI